MRTSLEAAREQIHIDTVNVLQSIIEKNYDAEKGYKKALKEAKAPELKNFLKRQAVQRSHFATAIDKELHLLDETPRDKGSIAGTLHRAWIDIRTSVTGNDDEAVLNEVLRGETASVKEYEELMKHNTLVPHASKVLKSQLKEIQGTLERVKSLKDIQG